MRNDMRRHSFQPGRQSYKALSQPARAVADDAPKPKKFGLADFLDGVAAVANAVSIGAEAFEQPTAKAPAAQAKPHPVAQRQPLQRRHSFPTPAFA
jgi:hypothetical protein